ncbi:MAG: D-glycero-beta-D-manno-heptose-7-phosphate kinase, partial [Candidatus Latescibacteria bacterium]|nr:D-glycero-beta-D-manno-heptose-7-phosphate kinase [bacterium]MBD3424079.1 D-glycero-beta-D-manno-heptose-7-phosphate kinase [Candidatus Latescibacterota bacterium]
YWGLVDRISPEAPVPVVRVEEENVRPGGASNVAWNLASLGCNAPLISVLGEDKRGDELTMLIAELDIPTGYLVRDPARVTTEKVRIVAHHQQVVRADFETLDETGGDILKKIIENIEKAVEGAGAVIISDYGKGIISASLMEHVRRICSKREVPILVDPKEGHFSLYSGAFAVTPNTKEAGGFYNTRIRNEEDLHRVGSSLLEDLQASAILITRGEEGMTLFREAEAPKDFPTRAQEVFDVTGAGDTVISVLAAALAVGADLEEAVELANIAAGIVVRELGTAAVNVKELFASIGS